MSKHEHDTADAATPAVETTPTSKAVTAQPPSGTIAISLAPEQWKQICNSFDWAKIAIAEQQPDLYTRVVAPQAGQPQDVHAGGKKIREDQNKAKAEADAKSDVKKH